LVRARGNQELGFADFDHGGSRRAPAAMRIIMDAVTGLLVVVTIMSVHAVWVQAAWAEAGADVKAKPSESKEAAAKPKGSLPHFDIDDFAVEGANTLSQLDVETAIYPFLGPNKTAADVEKARAALEKAYHDKGYQTVSVAVPQQNVQGKVVVFKVTELKVGRLRVKNARYFELAKIKAKARSLKEGVVPNFNDVTKDIVGLNLMPDRRVTPALRAGAAPGTVDVDLNVDDKFPLHGTVELNNRQSPSTVPLRVNATVHYDDLWQLGHSLTLTYQVAPQDPANAEAFSASYLARVPWVDWLSILVYGVKSNSDVASIGGTDIIGPGQIGGTRAVMMLPNRENFVQTLSIGFDYKHFQQTVQLGDSGFSSPVTYYPLVASYGATYQTDKFTTQLNASITNNLRPLSSDVTTFEARRANASPSFAHVNIDLSHTQELPQGFQIYGRFQGQVADGPLVSSEQFALGGLDTVRGYFESEALGDNGVVGNLEIRSPNVGPMVQQLAKTIAGKNITTLPTLADEWRFFAFTDRGYAMIDQSLAEEQSSFNLWSTGIGTRFKVLGYGNGMLALSVPLISQTYTTAGNPRVDFRIWGEF
jgi:hemolysin activation/secretion protein